MQPRVQIGCTRTSVVHGKTCQRRRATCATVGERPSHVDRRSFRSRRQPQSRTICLDVMYQSLRGCVLPKPPGRSPVSCGGRSSPTRSRGSPTATGVTPAWVYGSRRAICPHCHGRVAVLDFAAEPPVDELRGWTLAGASCEDGCALVPRDVPERHAWCEPVHGVPTMTLLVGAPARAAQDKRRDGRPSVR